jgi:ATP-dependent RNA helicase DDX56/DBP9
VCVMFSHCGRTHIIEEFNRGAYEVIVATDDAGDADTESTLPSDGAEEQATTDDAKQEESSEPGSAAAPLSTKQREFGVSRGIDFRVCGARACATVFRVDTESRRPPM